MNLYDRIHKPDRRDDNSNVLPIVERRGGNERREPRWLAWTRENEKRGKSLDAMRPAA